MVYEPRYINRHRRTGAEIAALDEAIVRAVEHDAPVTLRGVFYRAMSSGAVPKTEHGYRAVGRRLVELRRSGRVSYRDITDGTRWITKPKTFGGWEEAIEDAARSYRRALWRLSPYSLQLFTEKDAISGVIVPVTERWDVPLGVLRGYSSESFAWQVGQSLNPVKLNVVAQLGDHDPSGVGAWEDFSAKVRKFATAAPVEFERLAVTAAQVDEWKLPLRPTKRTDTRAKNWVGGSVEVDAIPAPSIRGIVESWIRQFVNQHQLSVLEAAEAEERKILHSLLHR